MANIHTIEYWTSGGSNYYELAFFDSNKILLSDISILGESGNWNERVIDLTENKYSTAAYVIASHWNEYSKPYLRTISGYANNESSDDNSTTAIDQSSKSTKGKTILIFGDSITETDSMNDDCSNYVENVWQSWATFAKEILQVGKMWNIARRGASYKDLWYVEERQKISHQISSAIASGKTADIIVISAGTNDGAAGSAYTGDYTTAMSKTSLEELDRTNLYEAIRWAMWTLKTHYPDAVCFVATPIQRADREPIPELTEAIIKMANRYNFIVIPAESESGIIRDNEVWEAEGHDLIDGLHPNENGQKKLARLYCSYILKHYI